MEKDPVWLRLISTAPQRPSRKAAAEMEWTLKMGKHKRRRFSNGLAQPSKLRKTVAASPSAPEHDGHVGIDMSPRISVQFCPEYRAQHEEAELLVMQMVHASSAFHKFYFLPADERPPANYEPVSLHKMLLQPHGRIVPTGNTPILWKVQVARLIAEAALKFDWLETRCRWGPWGHCRDVLQIASLCCCGGTETDPSICSSCSYGSSVLSFCQVQK